MKLFLLIRGINFNRMKVDLFIFLFQISISFAQYPQEFSISRTVKDSIRPDWQENMKANFLPTCLIKRDWSSCLNLSLIQTVIKDDFLVNDDSDIPGKMDQSSSSVAMNSANNYIIVWTDYRKGNHSDVYYQRFNSEGNAIGVNVMVNDDSLLAYQSSPAAAMDESGNFVIIWDDYRNGGNLNRDIYCQRYTPDGDPIGANLKVNDDTTITQQLYPTIAMDSSGNYIIVWQDARNGGNDVYYQRFDSSGAVLGSNIRVNDFLGQAFSPSIAMNGTGSFIIAWEDYRSGSVFKIPDIYYQHYNSSGNAIGVNTMVNTVISAKQGYPPSAAMDEVGNFVICWQDSRWDYSDIFYQRYDSAGTNIGDKIKVNDDTVFCYQKYASMTMKANGELLVSWEDYRNGDNNPDIYYQRYDSAGMTVGNNLRVNDDAGKTSQGSPSVVLNNLGNYIIGWTDKRDGNYDIYHQRFDSTNMAVGINLKANDDIGGANQQRPAVAMNQIGDFGIVWEDGRNVAINDIYCQRFNSAGVPIGANFKVNNDAGTDTKALPVIGMNETGGLAIVWWSGSSTSSMGNMYYQRYNSSGMAVGANVRVNANDWKAPQAYPSIAMAEDGSCMVVWEDKRDNYGDIYYQRYNPEGTALSGNTKVNDDTVNATQGAPSIDMDEKGNFVICWQDYRDIKYDADIYYQCYKSDGIPEGVNRKVNDNIGTAYPGSPTVSMDRKGRFVIVWIDSRIPGQTDIYFQRYDSLGSAIGANVMVNDDAGTANQLSPSIAMDNTDNFVIVWRDYRNNQFYPDVMGQRYYSDGSAWGANYQIVADGPNHEETSPDMSANANMIVCVWQDDRRFWDSHDIFGKMLTWDWEDGTKITKSHHAILQSCKLRQNFPNPFNPKTIIEFVLPKTEWVTLKVFNVLGQHVTTLVSEKLNPGVYKYEWQAENLPSGIYYCRMQTGDFQDVKKMILLR